MIPSKSKMVKCTCLSQVSNSIGLRKLSPNTRTKTTLSFKGTYRSFLMSIAVLLVLLPFTALHLAFGWVRWIRDAIDTVALLVEMRADDGARRHHAERLLALALVRLGSQGQSAAPAGALGAGDEVVTRVRRLLEPPRPLPVPAKLCAFGAALAFAGAPLLLLTCPA